MQLIEFNAVAKDGEPAIGKIWINPNHISIVEEYDENKTMIVIEPKSFYLINESTKSVLNKLLKNKKK